MKSLGLQAFMDLVGADDDEVAAAIDRDRTTVSRIRRGKVKPDGDTVLRLAKWAEKARRRKRLPSSKRLSWAGVFGDGAAA